GPRSPHDGRAPRHCHPTSPDAVHGYSLWAALRGCPLRPGPNTEQARRIRNPAGCLEFSSAYPPCCGSGAAAKSGPGGRRASRPATRSSARADRGRPRTAAGPAAPGTEAAPATEAEPGTEAAPATEAEPGTEAAPAREVATV